MIEKDPKLGHYRIETLNDWWRLVEENKGELRSIVSGHCVTFKDAKRIERNMEPNWIVPGGRFYGLNISGIYEKLQEEALEQFEEYIRSRNRKIHSMFSQAWWRAPDRPEIHDIPGWDVLCDLCSEDWVFWEEGER